MNTANKVRKTTYTIKRMAHISGLWYITQQLLKHNKHIQILSFRKNKSIIKTLKINIIYDILQI